MSEQLTFVQGVQDGASQISKESSVTGSVRQSIEESIAGLATDTQVTIAFPVTGLKGLYLVADGALTIQTNSGSAPDDTLTLAANVPLVWFDGCGTACPITVAVTKFYCTNSGASAVALRGKVLYDATP